MHAIGVDIGGTKIAAGVVDMDGRLVATSRRDTPAHDPVAIEAAVADLYRELATPYPVRFLGVAAAGFVDAARAGVVFAPNIEWRNYPLRERLRALVGDEMVIAVENDANAAGWAEFRFGAGRGVRHMTMLTVGTGVGGAVIADGRLVRGAWGMAGELGHIPIVPQGLPCGCGLRGCWEQYASGSALERRARHEARSGSAGALTLLELAGGDADAVRGRHVTSAARRGDPLAVGLLAEVGRWLGIGMASLVAVLDPAVVVVGGGVAAAGELLVGPARETLAAGLPGQGFRPAARIEMAALGNDAGVIGAADLARSGWDVARGS